MIPVVDVSQWQGRINFGRMRALGVEGVILRVTNGASLDATFADNVPRAHDAFGPQNVGVYSFINPKRGTGKAMAHGTVQWIEAVHGLADVLPFVMLDIESHQQEPPDRGVAITGDRYVQHLFEWMATFQQELPGPMLVGYSNASYWNHAVGQDGIASLLDWIVPRYPAYTAASYARRPLPPTADGWARWAAETGKEPLAPRGARGWAGWQFSAGFNGQAGRYGCDGTDLDLNIIRPEAWARWTSMRDAAVVSPFTPPSVPPADGNDYDPTQEGDVDIVTNAEQFGSAKPREAKFAVLGNGQLRHLRPSEHRAYGSKDGVELSNADLMELGVPPLP